MTLGIINFRSNWKFLKDYRPVHAVMFDVEREEGNNKRNPLYNMEYKVITTRKKVTGQEYRRHKLKAFDFLYFAIIGAHTKE